MTRYIIAFAILAVIVLAVTSALVFTGPRMRVQSNIRTFQATFPPMPEGTVPVVDKRPSVPSAEEAASLENPLSPASANVAKGEVYYGYYCVFCHGPAGDGDGPVGRSYVPTPGDLRTRRVRDLSDGQLLRRMLTGTGHEPALNRVILPEHRWYLVLYVRSLGKAGDAAP